MSLDRVRALVANDFEAVNHLIIEKIQSQVGLIDNLSHHIIESGGKRIRPLIVLLVSKACGYQGQMHIPSAAMIEFFHTATLLHDDVVDESKLRRGRKTANNIWGSKASILVGDYLLTQSMKLIRQVESWPITSLLTDTANEISCGELKQLANRHNPMLSIDDYLQVIRSKTALLFAASASMGAILANAGEPIETGLYNYGLHLGNAFQLVDDALDYCADPKESGKNIGTDLADGKATMPLIRVLQVGTAEQKLLVEQSLKEGNVQNLPKILDIIKSTQAIEFTYQFAAQEIDAALSSLQVLPNSLYKEALEELAEFALKRNF